MKHAMVLHNKESGDEEHGKRELITLLQEQGFECSYSSTKEKEWKEFDFQTDLLIIAGGDGTVRKVTKALLNRKMIERTWPIGLIPLGTANNIAHTLFDNIDPVAVVAGWKNRNSRRYDVGAVYFDASSAFFLESFGYGIFPYLMLEMKERNQPDELSPEESIRNALKVLHEIIHSYEPRYCSITVDGVDHSGLYIMIEVMNTKSIGPNLVLAPDADPGDGLLEIVTISADEKDKFDAFVKDRINGVNRDYGFNKIQGEKVTVKWDGTHVHIDDEIKKLEKNIEVDIELKRGLLQFLTA